MEKERTETMDQIVGLCLAQRDGTISLEEFRRRLQDMLNDTDALVNIAIDVERLELFRREYGD